MDPLFPEEMITIAERISDGLNNDTGLREA